MSYEVVEIRSKKDLKAFVKFPDRLYKNCPQYVPALHSDQIKTLTANPALTYCTTKLWMVKKDGEWAGRICAIINPRYNERYSTKRVRFGWFDTVEDLEVARLLIQTAEAWAKEQGMNEIHGPLFYNTLGKQGMLVEGFENIPPFNCIYNYPYYNDFITALGFEKECDWVQYKVVADKGVPEKAKRVAKIVKERYNVHAGDLDKLKKDPKLVKYFFDMYNSSFASSVYNFIPFTDEEIADEARMSMPFISNKTSCILLDENDQLVAFGIVFPSISKALQKAKGHLFPFGWIHFLKALRKFDTVDLMLNGAVPEWQNKGISSVYYSEMADRALKQGYKWGITNPQIESNSAVNLWKDYEKEDFMRRRCYLKKID